MLSYPIYPEVQTLWHINSQARRLKSTLHLNSDEHFPKLSSVTWTHSSPHVIYASSKITSMSTPFLLPNEDSPSSSDTVGFLGFFLSCDVPAHVINLLPSSANLLIVTLFQPLSRKEMDILFLYTRF